VATTVVVTTSSVVLTEPSPTTVLPSTSSEPDPSTVAPVSAVTDETVAPVFGGGGTTVSRPTVPGATTPPSRTTVASTPSPVTTPPPTSPTTQPPPPTTEPPPTPPTTQPPPACVNDVRRVGRAGTVSFRECADGIHLVLASAASPWFVSASVGGPPTVTVQFTSNTGQTLTCTITGNNEGANFSGSC